MGRLAPPARLGRIADVARGPVLDPGRAAGAAAPGWPHPRARARSRVLPTPGERSEAAGAGRSASGRRDASRCSVHRDRGPQAGGVSVGAARGAVDRCPRLLHYSTELLSRTPRETGTMPCTACTQPSACKFYPAVRPVKAEDRKSTRLNSSHVKTSYAVFCLKKKKKKQA